MVPVQVWYEVLTYGARWQTVRNYMIVVDTVRNTFGVVSGLSVILRPAPWTVARKKDLYVVSRPYAALLTYDLVFRVREGPPHLPHSIEVVEGSDPYLVVLYADGWRVASKGRLTPWKPAKYAVPPPNPQSLPALLEYGVRAVHPVYRLESGY